MLRSQIILKDLDVYVDINSDWEMIKITPWLLVRKRTIPTGFPSIRTNLAELKKYKSSGSDQMPAELIHAGGEKLRHEIHELLRRIWNEEELPDQWKEFFILPNYTGDEAGCSNYNGISLLSTS
jgi:hypothetical protein